jgi:hypothetical protein
MKYSLFLVQWMVLATAVAPKAFGAKAVTNTLPSGNRFLFVVETSAAMNRLEHGGRQAVFELIYSGVEGRMSKGDTYGIWTFNQNVYAGVYPMQVWDGQRSLEHASAVGRFLKVQKYEKEPNLTNVVNYLQMVVRTVKDVNVFLVTDGSSAIAGTPFDETINGSYRTNRAQVRDAKRPLVTTLTARNGQFTGACVSFAGEKIQLADLPLATNVISSVGVGKTGSPPTLTNASPKAPAGQMMSVADLETNAGKTNPATAGLQVTNLVMTSAEATTTNAPPVKRIVIIKKEAPDTNTVADPVSAAPPTGATVSNVVAASPTNVAPLALVPMTNEVASPRPEPLPAVVPAQVTVSARTVNEAPKLRNSASPSLFSNALLTIGGIFLGMSVLGAVVFIRRIRSAKEPSFISQGMEKR